MPATQRDLWPSDIRADDVLTPEEIMQEQGDALETRTNGLIRGEVVRLETDDRIVLGFEIASTRINSRIRLFDAMHRKDCDYPVAIQSNQSNLPVFLRSEYFVPGAPAIRTLIPSVDALSKGTQGEWRKNDWVANSPTEFTDLVGKIFGKSEVKATVISLISRSQRAGSSPEQPSSTEPE